MNQIPNPDSQLRKTIAIYFPYFMGGGAEAVGLWMLEALKKKYHLTLYTFADLHWEKLNDMYGTFLSSEQVQVKSILPSFALAIANFLIANNPHFRQLAIHSTLRVLKANSHDYDLVISGFNAADLGTTGIQYIHWVNVLEGGPLGPLYSKLSRFSLEQAKKNISLVNSSDVAAAVQRAYGIESEVIYPPVIIAPQTGEPEQKEDAFVCSGRLVKSKQPHQAIKIFKKLRQKGYDIKLYITGGGGGSTERKYTNTVRNMAKANADWVTLYENLSYADYTKLLYKCKYGIHIKTEPFGISVAEMVKAGAIPFVKSKGGQTEIVGTQNRELFFDNADEAVEKIIAVLENTALQKKLIQSLKEQQNIFSTGRFGQEIINIVDRYFSKQI